MYSWWSAPLGNVRVLLVCFAGIALSSLGTWPVSDLKVASGKPKRKHCSKRISQEQEEKENIKKSRPFKQMPPRRAPVFLLSPGINTRGTTLPPCWSYLCHVVWYRPIRHFSPVKSLSPSFTRFCDTRISSLVLEGAWKLKEASMCL